jgi:hypothetical protein
MTARCLVVGSLVLVAAGACGAERRAGPGPAPSAEKAFWDWFAAHAAEAATIKTAREPVADQLAAALQQVDARLTFEIGSHPGQEHELVISADGLKSAFPAVRRLVAAAPPVRGWRVTAFRPRKGADSVIQLGDGTELGADSFRFSTLAAGPKGQPLSIAIYVKGKKDAGDAALKFAVFLFLDSLLGEYDVETWLGAIDIRPDAAAPADARPIRELTALVDGQK